MRIARLLPVAGAILLGLIVLAPEVWPRAGGSAQADAILVVGYDMVPAGNSCPNDGTDCALGSIDACVETSAGSTVQFDVFLDGIPDGDSYLGAGYYVGGWAGTLEDPDGDGPLPHRSVVVNLTMQAPGSALTDISEPLPDILPPWFANIADFGAAEYNPPFTKGVLGRYALTVPSTASPGVYGLTLNEVVLGRDVPPGGQVVVDQVWDMNFTPQYGLIGIDRSCVGAVATPLPTATPSPTPPPTTTPAASPTPPVTGTPPPGATTLNAGWNYVCHRGPEQPVDNALGQTATDVLAMYRLRPDQGYDRWFAGRPELNTMTTVGAHDPLFILMAKTAWWAQGDAGTPPPSAALSQGWNGVCYAGQTKTTEAATAGIAGKFGVLYSLAPDQSWKRYVPGRSEISTLPELSQFTAVLILSTAAEATVWTFDP